MDWTRRILPCIVLAYMGCASVPQKGLTDDFSSTIGIASHPNDTPLDLDILTSVIPLNADGTMPRMAVHVKHSNPKEFLVSYNVYRLVQGSNSYALTETSPLWRIHAGAMSADAFIRPDFPDGILIGKYRFQIFIDQKPWRTVEFKVIPHGGTSASGRD
jgi:hypothetical protein